MRRAYEDSLERIREQNASFGDPNQPQAPADALARLTVEARETLDYDVPDDYLHFLRLSDGLHFNGFSVFASSTVPIAGYTDRFIGGFVDSNLRFRNSPVHRHLIVFGESGDDAYVYDTRTRTFALVDHPSLDVLETFGSFDEMMASLLERALNV